jgi:hypothetical protein
VSKTADSILRKGRFRVQGRQRIGAGRHKENPEPTPDARTEEIADQLEAQLDQTPPATQPAQARIIEQAGGICVIEVTCGCGQVVHLQCFVDPSAQTPAPQGPGPQENAP